MPIDKPRPSIPNAVKRALRQEAGFGCCVCGLPIFQYHHIVEWSEEHHNRPEDMMVLCPNHHDQASKGAFPEAEQRAFKASPFNILRGLAAGLLKVSQEYPALVLGSVQLVNEGPVLEICGEEILSLELQNGALLLSLVLRSQSGVELCRIENNEWISGNPIAWDIQADYRELIIRERAGSINLSLNAKTIPAELSGAFWSDGHWVKVRPDGIHFGTRSINISAFSELALVGMVLRLNEAGIQMAPGTPAGATLVSWPNRRERLWKAATAWKEIKSQRLEAELAVHTSQER